MTVNNPINQQPLEQLAAALSRHGLATPARMMLDVIAPLGFIAGQLTLFARPFVPRSRWTSCVDLLCDERGWATLRDILKRDC